MENDCEKMSICLVRFIFFSSPTSSSWQPIESTVSNFMVVCDWNSDTNVRAIRWLSDGNWIDATATLSDCLLKREIGNVKSSHTLRTYAMNGPRNCLTVFIVRLSFPLLPIIYSAGVLSRWRWQKHPIKYTSLIHDIASICAESLSAFEDQTAFAICTASSINTASARDVYGRRPIISHNTLFIVPCHSHEGDAATSCLIDRLKFIRGAYIKAKNEICITFVQQFWHPLLTKAPCGATKWRLHTMNSFKLNGYK